MTSLYFFLSGRCVNAEPATRFTAFGVFGFRRSLDAILPICFDVFSFLAILSLHENTSLLASAATNVLDSMWPPS